MATKKSFLYRRLFKGNPMKDSKVEFLVPHNGDVHLASIETKVTFDYSNGIELMSNKDPGPGIVLDRQHTFYPKYTMKIVGRIEGHMTGNEYVETLVGATHIHQRETFKIDIAVNDVMLSILKGSDLFPLITRRRVRYINWHDREIVSKYKNARFLDMEYCKCTIIRALIDGYKFKDIEGFEESKEYYGLTTGLYTFILDEIRFHLLERPMKRPKRNNRVGE